jgi:hypothetical protein
MEHLTLADVLCRAVDELVTAIDNNDTAKIEEIRSVLSFLYAVNTHYGGPSSEHTEHYRDPQLTLLLDDLLDAMRDWYMQTPWKSTMPSHDKIRSLLA